MRIISKAALESQKPRKGKAADKMRTRFPGNSERETSSNPADPPPADAPLAFTP